MKQNSIIIALVIGFLVFSFNWGEKSSGHSNNAIKIFVIAFGMYYGMKRQFKKIKLENKEVKISYAETFKIGLYICLVASIFSSFLFYSMPPENAQDVTSGSEKLLHSFDILLSIIIIGIISIAISARILTKKQS